MQSHQPALPQRFDALFVENEIEHTENAGVLGGRLPLDGTAYEVLGVSPGSDGERSSSAIPDRPQVAPTSAPDAQCVRRGVTTRSSTRSSCWCMTSC